ncbi:MAG: hypothetical protein OEV91_01265, partial [Desulfobulbaceae bacterium]|nr:hypothetical protein [Desulfobulbaceae bacterium]
MTAPLPGFIAIDQRCLLGEEHAILFDIYIIQRINDTPTPILLIGKETPVAAVRDILTAKRNRLGTLYIKKDAAQDFQEFMEDSLHLLIVDPAMPEAEKSKFVYECAKNVLADVFDDPRSGKNLARTRKVTDHMVDFILTSHGSVLNLLNLGSHDYYTFSHCVNVAVFSLGLWLMIG